MLLNSKRHIDPRGAEVNMIKLNSKRHIDPRGAEVNMIKFTVQ